MMENRYIILDTRLIIRPETKFLKKAVEYALGDFDERFYENNSVSKECHIFLKKAGKNIELIWNNEAYICEDANDAIAKLYKKIGDFYSRYEYFHAGVVNFNGYSIALVGPKGSGKTTLTLGLVKQGFKFLTDESAFFDVRSGNFMPFLRPLKLLNNTKGKRFMHINRLFPNSVGKPSPPKYLFIMDGLRKNFKAKKAFVRKIKKYEAMPRLLASGFKTPGDFKSRFIACAAIVEKADCFEIIRGDIDNAIFQITKIAGCKYSIC